MNLMFAGASNLTRLNLSGDGWDTRNAWMGDMFGGTFSLRELTLGRNFVSNTWLHPVPTNENFTGKWQNVGAGTVDNPRGAHVLTSEELMAGFNGETMADTWVWKPVRHSYGLEVDGWSGGGIFTWISAFAALIMPSFLGNG